MTKPRKTILGRLQAEIDRCNKKNGCDAYCSKVNQGMCPLLRRHAERIAYLREQNIPPEKW